MFKAAHKTSPIRKNRILDFDSPSVDNKCFKKLIERINCSKNIMKAPNGALESPTCPSKNILPQSLNLRLMNAGFEDNNANISLSKPNVHNLKGSPHKTGWIIQKSCSLSLEERIENCLIEDLNPLETSKNSFQEKRDFLNRSLPTRNLFDSSQKMEIETERTMKSFDEFSSLDDLDTDTQSFDKPEQKGQQDGLKTLYFTPSPKKKLPNHNNLTAKSIKQERKYFEDFNSAQRMIVASSLSNQTQQDQGTRQSMANQKENISPVLSQEFQIIEVIGEGSFGTVFKCKSLSDSKLYAIKRTNRKMKGAYRDLALNEVNTLDRISSYGNCENVVKYFGNWIEDNNMFIAMEHCSTNLRELWKKKSKFSEEEAVYILYHLAKGVEFLHSRDIVHMDLKPGNRLLIEGYKKIILLDNILFENGSFKLADFGQSRIISPEFNGDFEEGDSRYLAPELLNLNFTKISGNLLKAADIFSLGMTAYEIITNCELPARGIVWQALRKGRFDALDNLTNLSSSLRNLVKSMIDKNSEKRPSANEIVLQIGLLLNESESRTIFEMF